MNYGDYVKAVSEKAGLSQAETKRMMQKSFEVIVEELVEGKRLTLPQLGTFDTKVRDQHRAYNPAYEKFMLYPKKRVVTFYPGSFIKEEMNKGEAK